MEKEAGEGRSVGRHAKLAQEESRQVCLMFLLTSMLFKYLPLIIFFYLILLFMSVSD